MSIKAAVATFEVVILNPDPNMNGILNGTEWTLDWGDGTPLVTYLSTADNDIPPLPIRTHTYSTATTCNYVFSNGIRNPCGQTRAVQYIAVVHGRDINSDGDGRLRIVNNADGSAIINVCEGVQSIITIRDNSIWNCQNPTLPGGLTPVANTEPRNIEWLYGQDPGGVPASTITGNVSIAGLGNAPQTSGRISPVPYGPSSLSQAITIPATCVAGQSFTVYLKNWNKCNWTDPEYIFTSIDINVVAAPPAPDVANKTICFGGDKTLTVTSPVVGSISWYSDAALTTLVGTGVSFTTPLNGPATYNFWAVDKANTGLQCQGPARQVTLIINQLPNKPTITNTGNLEFCFDGITTVVLHANVATPPAVTSYQWYKNGAAIPGATAIDLTLSQGSETGSYTVAALGANPTNCPGPQSNAVSVIIHSLANLVNPVPAVVCENGIATFTASTTDLVQNWQWEVSTNGGASFSTTGNGPPYSGFNTNTLTLNPVALSFNGYLYRVEIKTPPGQGGCPFKSAAASLTVNPNAVLTLTSGAGSNNQSPCINTPISNITWNVGGSGTGAGVAGLPAGVSGSFSGGVFTISGTPTASGTFNYTVTTTGTCTQATATGTITVRPDNTITRTSGAATENQTRCINTAISNIRYTTTGATGATFSGLPAGVNGVWAANNITISGTPTASGLFSFTITLTGGCGVITRSGTITVNPNNTITRTSAAATENQTVCISTTITNITYTTTSASGASFSGLPAGVSGNWAASAITISGTPTASGSFSYTITLTGGCGTITRSGTIDVTPNNTITRTSAAGTDNQTVCISTPITNITYSTTGATGATFSNLPAGVNGSRAGNTITISGTPTASGTFNYTITLTGGCGVITRNGTITVSPNNTITRTSAAGTDNQTVCANSTITNITYSTTGASGATFSGLPAGVSGGWAGNIVTISGAPTATGTFNYTITLTGGCGVVTRNGTIIVNVAATVNAGPDQSICALGTATLAGSVGGSAVSGTWSGGLGSYVPNANNLHAVYTPSAGERAAKTVTLTLTTNDPAGVCTAVSDNVTISIGAALTAATLTGSGDICFGTASTLSSVITGGAPPYTINYTRNGSAQPAITPYTSGNPINLGVLPVGTYTYLITSVTDPCGNSVPPGSLPPAVTITINGLPDVTGTIPASQNICSDGTATLTLVSTVNNTTFNWTVSSAPGFGYTWSAGKDPVGGSLTDADGNGTETITRQLQHNYNAPVSVFYTITPIGPGPTACPGSPVTVTRSVTVNPVPAITDITTAICSATAFSVTPVNGTDGVVPAGTRYTWTAPVISPAGAITGGSAQAVSQLSIGQTLTNTTNAPATATYTITPVSGACTGATFQLVVTVNPKPTIANKITTTCSATAFNVSPTDGGGDIVPGTTTYTWNNPVIAPAGSITGGSAQGTGQASISQTLTNTTNANATATYTVTPTAGGCAGTTFTVRVTVNPTATITDRTATICSENSFTVTPANGGGNILPVGTLYTWAAPLIDPAGSISGSSAQGTGQINISQTLTNTTNAVATATYTVTPTSGTCTGATFTITVTVNPKASIANTTATICSGDAFSVTPVNSGAEIVPGGTTYTWAAPVIAPAGSISGGSAQGTGQASISQTLTNTTNASATARYTVTPHSGACTGATFTITVTVNPKATITNKTATICSGTSFSVTPVNGAGNIVPVGTTYTWAAPVIAPGGSISGSSSEAAGQTSISQTLTNTTNTVATATYTVTPTSGTCTGATFDVTVTVNPVTTIADKTPTICSGTAFTVAPVNGGAEIVPGGTTYTWTAPVIAPAGAITGGSLQATGQASISQTLTNTTNTDATATYTVTPTSGSCTGATFRIQVTVSPKATISNKTDAICSGSSFTVTPVNGGAEIVPGGTLYTWAAPIIAPGGSISGGSVQGTGQASISQTLTNTTNASATATYTVTPISGACTGATFTITVTVNPKATIANKTATICSGNAFTVTPANGGPEIVPGATTYTWTAPVIAPAGAISGGSAQGTGQASISQTLTNTTNASATATYTVTPVSGGCTGATFQIQVTVSPKATISDKTATICSAAAFSIAPVNLGAEIVPVGTLYTWAAPVIAPAGAITGGSAQVVGQASIGQTLTNNTTAPATAKYTVIPQSGACNGATFTVTVTVNPPGQVDQPANETVCNNTNTPVINFTTVNTIGITSYTWTNSAPGIGLLANGSGPIGAFTAINAGTAPIVATIIVTPTFTYDAVGCAGSPKTFTITINPTPTLSSSLAPPDVCSNTVFSYVPASATGGTSFDWIRAAVPGITPAGPTTGPGNPNEILRNMTNAPIAVTYQYTLSSNLCSNTQDVVVNIKPEPVITAGQTTTACSGNVLDYQILLDNFANPGDNVTFIWAAPVLDPADPNFTGGTARGSASAANITDVFTNTTGIIGKATYTITPYKNGCAGTPETVVITVGSEPVLDPGLDAFACSNTPIGLILKEAVGSVVPTYYNILGKTVDFGLSESGNAAVPNVIQAPAGYLSNDVYINTLGLDKTVTYKVQPVLGPDCFGDPVDVVITIHPQPVILPAQIKTVCSGVAIGKEIVLVPGNTPAGTLFNWPLPSISDFSVQGTAGTDVAADPAGTIHINDMIDNLSGSPITATYTITPVSSFGCAGTPTTAIITINPEPIPQPISGRDKICISEKNVLYNINNVSGSTFHWTVDAAIGTKIFDFNANAILVDAAAVPGSGNITVYETNSYVCKGDISTKTVEVYSVPAPENITGPAEVCANSTHVYSVTNRPGSVYNWTIPGGTAILGDPSASSITLIFANVGGAVSVRETTSAGCIVNHFPLGVTLNQLPTATISGGSTICDGGSGALTVDFTGTGPYSFTYALNGVPQPPINTSADPYALNVTQAGTYTIVNVTDANCTNTGTGTTTVAYFPKPTGTISGTSEMCRGASTVLTMTFTGTAPYTFTYTDGFTPVTVTGHLTNVYTVSVSPLVSSTYTLTSVTDGNSCTGVLSGSAVITVNLPPVLSLAGTNLICYNVNTGSVDMTITDGTAPFGISWTGPDLFTATSEDISGLKAGYYAVTVLDTKGCTGTANITLTQPPVLNGSATATNVTCFGASDGTITISGATGGTGTYEYTINGGTSWEASPNYTGLAPGTYNVVMRDIAHPTCMLTLNSALQITGPDILAATVVPTDVNCFGANNGSIVISSPTGGYGTYGYSINGGSSWQGSGNFANLPPGNYDVMIRDAVHMLCEMALTSLTIVQPPVLSATVNSTNISCFGSTDGTITISAPSGGHGTWEYSINGGGSWQPAGNYTNLSPGTYNVQIRDAAFTGCYIILNNALVITQPAVLNASVASSNVTCNGADDGIINITSPTGGHGTYEYTIDGTNWQGAGLFNGLAPGTYDVRIRDGANITCEIILNAGLQITQPGPLSALVIDSDVTCFGANDGIITITNSAGGYGTYQYTVDGGANWQDSPTFPGLLPATYDVWIRDKAHIGCELNLDPAVLISEPDVLDANVAFTNVTCSGAGDGTITISSSTGGYGAYSYSINGGTSWQGSGTFNGLVPGTYNIRIRDAAHAGCVIALNPAIVITEPVALSATLLKTNVTCNGAADGTITINGAAGGYGSYEYTVDGGLTWQASNIFAGLIPGFYNVKIRDAANHGCIFTINGSLSITEPQLLNATVNHTNVTCNGTSDGTITVSAPSGGYGTYQYRIDGVGAWQISGLFTGLAPGNYVVQIRDAANQACVITLIPNLVITEPAVLAAIVTSTDVSCFGANNGIISVTGASGGYGTYEYSINGGTNWYGTGNFTNLPPAIYIVMIRDAAHTACETVLDGNLQISQPGALTATVTRTNVTCFGTSDGTITISAASGGYGTYDYSINGGGSWQSSGIFTNLGPGNYNVQIRDAAHITCVIVLNNALQITQPAVLHAVVSSTNVTCNSADDGIISITVPTGGSGAYEYSVDGGSTWSASGLFNGLAPATYEVRIRDFASPACEIILNNNLTITEPEVLNAAVSWTNVTCFAAANGTITVSSPTGGYGTFEYSRDGGANWQATGIFSNLPPAIYNVQIRDKAHSACVMILNSTLEITEPAILSATLGSANVTCFSANDGTITITNPLGGYGTYNYTVNGGTTWQSSGSFTGLAPGTYNVRMRDAAHITCEMSLAAALVITQPPVLSGTVSSTNITCFNASDGTITISNPLGGYGNYEYSVNGGASWQVSGNFTALTPGFYNVQIRDAANITCVKTLNGSLRITEPAILAASVFGTNVTCNGAADGKITIISASGGYGTYAYSIDGGSTWQPSGTFNALAPDTYNVQIQDAANPGCFMVLNPTLVITEPAVLSATITPTNVTCNGANDGTLSITAPSGGYGSYQYTISGGSSWSGSGYFTNLAPATYDVQMRDAANPLCIETLNSGMIITQPDILSATISSTNVSCFGGNDGTITISNAAGGYGAYEYSINGGGSWQASPAFAGLTTGSYSILIRDAAHIGCVIVLNSTYPVTQPALLSAAVSKTDVTCNGANDGTISITLPSGGYGTYDYSIDGGTTWQPSGNYTNVLPGTYDVRLRDGAHALCSVILYPNLVITEPIPLAMTSTGDIALNCFGDNSGSGTFYASGGTMPYVFTVIANTAGATISFPGFNSQTFFGAGAGTVTVSVSDHNGCFAQGTIIIGQPALLTPGTIDADQVICSGSDPAMITETVSASGGPAVLTYQWQYGSTVAGPFINIAGANANVYTPAPGANTTLYYRRMVTSGMCAPVYSNVVEVKVNLLPLAILSGGETICPGQTSNLKVDLPVGLGPFEVEITNYGTIPAYASGTNIPVTPLITTEYSLVRVRDANNCEILGSSPNLIGKATVTVRALPSITIDPVSKTTCEFGIVKFSVRATGSDLTFRWYVNGGGGFIPVTDGGIYYGATDSILNLFGPTRLMNGNVYRVVVSGCAATDTSATAILIVNTPPEIVRQPKDSTICMNAGATFRVTATGTSAVYRWQVNTGAGFVDVINGANFSGANDSILTIINAPGTFNNNIFRVIISGTCGAPVYSNFAVLRVLNPPVITLNPVNKPICDGVGPVLFTANGSGMIDSLRWQVFSGGSWSDIYDDSIYSGSSSQQLTLSKAPFAFNGNQYHLSLKAKCTTVNSTNATLTVYPNPVVDFSAVDPINACGGVPLVINGNPSGGSGIWASHLWTGDVGPLNNYYIQSPTFISQIAGTYPLTYQVKDSRGCIGSDDVSVVVDAPDATFAWDKNSGCTPATISFSKNMAGIVKFWWNFDDGTPIDSVNANPVHQFTNVNLSSIEYHNVNLTVRSPGGCLDTYTTLVTIYPAVDATFTANPDTVCSGNSVSFTAQSGASKYFWDYGDGVNGYSTQSATHLYTNINTVPEVHTVTLTTTSFYNCTNVKTLDIVVMPVPMPQFNADPPSQIFNAAGNPVKFTNQTNGGTWNWIWRFGDGDSTNVQDPTHIYSDVGTFNVTLIASNSSCSESVTHQVNITYGPPVADFDTLLSGCEPLSLVINNTSLNTDIPGTTYKWEFGDGSISTAKNPTYTYFDAGTYRVELTVTGPGGTSIKSQVVSSYASPKAYFEVSPIKVFVNDERVRCFNLSEGASYYVWDFGDGDTSRVAEPYHKYMYEGVYDITLWAYSQNGCSDKYLLSPGVTVEPAGDIRFSTVFTPNKSGEIDMDHLPTGGPEIDQFFFPPIQVKVLKYKLQIFNRWGVLIFQTNDINKPWNGYYQHKLCPQGVYVWYVEGKYENGSPFKKVGDVTLMH